MATRQVGLTDVRQGGRPPRLKLLAPLRYLAIRNPEKDFYDIKLPIIIAVIGLVGYFFFFPKLPIFGDSGLLRFTRDFLIMALPFMVGCLAAVAMGTPGNSLDRRPIGAELFLGDRILTMRQFVCYLLGYLCFISFFTLTGAVSAHLLHDSILSWLAGKPLLKGAVRVIGMTSLSVMLSSLSITTLWALYFLTDVVNRPTADRSD
jgi:hypothetical protein